MEVEEKNNKVDTTTTNTNTININDQIDKKSTPFKLDFESILASSRDEPPPEIVVLPPAASADGGDKHRRSGEKRRKPKEGSMAVGSSTPGGGGGGDNVASMSEADLKAAIERSNRMIRVGALPDKGAKLKVYLQRLQDELDYRRRRSYQEDASGWKKPALPASASSNGTLEKPKVSVPSSQPSERSQFATLLRKKLEDNGEPKSEQNTGNQASNAFDHEISYLSRGDKRKDDDRASNVSDHEVSFLNPCDKWRRKPFGQIPQRKRAKPALSSKGFAAWNPSHPSRNSDKYMSLNGFFSSKSPSTGSLPISKEKQTGSFYEKDDAPALNSDHSKKEKTVVLVDEEEPDNIEERQDAEAEPLPSSTNDSKIYYPSREDPESLEIFRSELKCLEPGECLTSTIMNFYIRFLQISPSERLQRNFYFFNTYFYSKLQKAIAYKKSDREAFFIKFRRWWKGVNIFQKAYILLPINEDNHWSLVIICIPDKEDESGLIILHLDSLGLHSSRSIFDNIRSLLINEWKLLSEDDGVLEIPISERLWKFLPRRIDEKIITVPRQTNDYDCGLFVLYYMERFIEEAPDRLRRQHLNMFGRNWFKPQEASRLRGKIKRILHEEFHKALREDKHVMQPVCLSANAETAKAIDPVKNS